MANYLFDCKFNSRIGGGGDGGEYRILIGSFNVFAGPNPLTDALDIYDPGIKINWAGDQDRFTNPIMGSTLSFTARLNDDGLEVFEDCLDQDEGDVFCLFFDSHDDQVPYWYGHLVIEACSIRVENEYHRVDMEFTDGLASLRGQKWEDAPNDMYTGFKKLSFYIRELVSKLPAREGFKYYLNNTLNQTTSHPVFREVGLPQPVTVDGENKYRYDETDYPFDKIRVRADTFNIPKKKVNRIRELEAPQDYLDSGSVLEDICIAWGATACMFDGYINIGNRCDIASHKGENVYAASYDYNPIADSFTISGVYNLCSWLNFDQYFQFRSGIVKSRTMPISQVNLVHEEGGSDFLAAFGYYLNSTLTHIDYSAAAFYQSVVSSQGGTEAIINLGGMTVDGRRRDLWYDFDEDGDFPGRPAVNLPFYQYPIFGNEYIGFPASTVSDLEISSGENMRLTFGGNTQYPSRGILAGFSDDLTVGATFIVRVRIQMTTTAGDSYRLSRCVHTHAVTNGSPDFIRIDMNNYPFFSSNDRYYFRKLYRDLVWLKDDHADYEDDGWFEIIVPHGDNENSGEGYGSTLFTLTQLYDGQESYAPIGTKIEGDNDGPGVILEFSPNEEGTWNQYWREDIQFTLPQDASGNDLSFEEFYFEMGCSQFEADRGPRSNASNPTGKWKGEDPLWRSAFADGTGGFLRSGGYDKKFTPDYIHFSGLRVTVGDGSESADLTTKINGGDGYEIYNAGSTRLGSRLGIVNHHVNGTMWAAKKASATDGDFVTPTEYQEKIQWIGHRADELPGIDNELYDSIHGYVAESFLHQFGKNVAKYNGVYTFKQVSGNGFAMLQHPFRVAKTAQLNDITGGISEFLMPLSYQWIMNEGVSGEFLIVGQQRNRITVAEEVRPRPLRGNTGGIVGMVSGVDTSGPIFGSRRVANNFTIDDDSGELTGATIKTGISDFINADNVSQGSTNKFATQAELTAVADSKTVTDLITVSGGEITEITLASASIEADRINQSDPDFLFVNLQQKNQIGTDTTARNTANAAKAKTDLITTDSEGITGFTVGDGVTVLSTDQVTEDAGRKFVSATNESKLEKITFTHSPPNFPFNLDTQRSNINSAKAKTDLITVTGTAPNDKITSITTTNGEFDVDDGRQKMGFLTSDATGITQITVSASVDVDLDDAGAFFAGSSGETASRGGVTGNRVLLIDSNGGMDEVADGSSGQFLQTNGSGSYSFASAGGGWHGNTTLIKVSPTEWVGNDLGRAITQVRIEEDTANKLGVQINQSTGTIFAFNEIPTGYKATHVKVYASSTVSNGVEVLHYNTTTGVTSNSTTGNTNTSIDITDMTSSTTNMLVISVTPGATNVFVFSAEITIATV